MSLGKGVEEHISASLWSLGRGVEEHISVSLGRRVGNTSQCPWAG